MRVLCVTQAVLIPLAALYVCGTPGQSVAQAQPPWEFHPQPPPWHSPPQSSLVGRLTRVAAIGGETTGWAVETARSQREIDIPARLRRQAEQYEGSLVRVSGYWSSSFGPERGRRRVLRADAIQPVQERRPDRWRNWPPPRWSRPPTYWY